MKLPVKDGGQFALIMQLADQTNKNLDSIRLERVRHSFARLEKKRGVEFMTESLKAFRNPSLYRHEPKRGDKS